MAKHPLSSIIMGIVFIAGAIALFLVILLVSSEEGLVWLLIYAIPMLIVGIVLLLWKKEDDIEQRKDLIKMKENGKFSSKHETRLKGGKK